MFSATVDADCANNLCLFVRQLVEAARMQKERKVNNNQSDDKRMTVIDDARGGLLSSSSYLIKTRFHYASHLYVPVLKSKLQSNEIHTVLVASFLSAQYILSTV